MNIQNKVVYENLRKLEKQNNGKGCLLLFIIAVIIIFGLYEIINHYNDIKIYMDAKGISKANVVLETPNASPITVVNRANEEKAVWSIVSILILLCIMRSAKKQIKPKSNIELIKEREMALYRNFQKEIASMPSINYKLKSYKKHVLKGETLRHYNNAMTKV